MPNIPLRLRLIVGLLFVLVAYVSIIWPDAILYLVLGIFAIAVLVDRFLRQQVAFEEQKPRKSRTKKVKVDDDIPPDPTWEELRATLGRMAQGPTTAHAQPQGPVQYTLWGTPEPVKTEQNVRPTSNNSSVPEEPEWFKQSFR